MEKSDRWSDCWWRGAIAGGGERSLVEGSDRRWKQLQVERSDRRRRGAIAGGEERSLVERKDCRWRVAFSDRRGRSQEEGVIAGGGERCSAIAGGGERSLVEGSDFRWRTEQRSRERLQMEGSDRRRGAIVVGRAAKVPVFLNFEKQRY